MYFKVRSWKSNIYRQWHTKKLYNVIGRKLYLTSAILMKIILNIKVFAAEGVFRAAFKELYKNMIFFYVHCCVQKRNYTYFTWFKHYYPGLTFVARHVLTRFFHFIVRVRKKRYPSYVDSHRCRKSSITSNLFPYAGVEQFRLLVSAHSLIHNIRFYSINV